MISLLLGALVGSVAIVGPMVMEGDDEELAPEEDEVAEGDLLDDDEGIPDLNRPSSDPVDDTGWTGAAPPPSVALQQPGGPDGIDVIPGNHLTDPHGASLAVDKWGGVDATTGTASADNYSASELNDLIMGNEGEDTLDGLGGDDYIDGGADDDLLAGGLGDDQLRGMSGDDLLDGGGGNDLMAGDDGDDTLQGGTGNDTLFAGRGADILDGGDGDDVLDGSHFDDAGADGGADTLSGGDGDDIIALGASDIGSGGDGADLFVLGGSGVFEPSDAYPLPRVLDFDPNTDALELVLDGDAGAITTLAENGGITILVGGDAVAHLDGLSSLDTSLIRLTAA
jgi:Ca2+-binding RTX toxin-like protein